MRIEEFSPDPLKQFKLWLEQAVASNEVDPYAFSLATASANAVPSVRPLLYKGVAQYQDQVVITFFSNTCSQKGQDLHDNPRAEMMFYWPSLYRQLRIAGDVVLLTREQTEQYFASRSQNSKLSAFVSHQSEPIESHESLERKVSDLQNKMKGQEIPCPPYWQGYGLLPKRFEFWLGRDHRLHDRLCYTKDENGHWAISCLSP
jgi:pyridoxamine 5'-phosphate oxidase